jgi:D-aminoacyl-tRNA deacylase
VPRLKLLVYSKLDLAGANIASRLTETLSFSASAFHSFPSKSWQDFYLIGVDQGLIDLEMPSEGVEWAIFLSKHKSASGKGCLTAHTSGNLASTADLGGNPGSIAISNPVLQSALLGELKRAEEEMRLGLQVTVEATHHGPTELPFPVTFVEIGSDESAWNDHRIGEAVAKAVSRCIAAPHGGVHTALGVGGGHYSEKFTELMVSQAYAIGHIIPRYVLTESLDRSIFQRCIDRTFGGCSCIVADWKGTPSAFKDYLKSFSQASGKELIKV